MQLRGTCLTTLEEAVQGADLVQENVPETVDFKQAMYADLERIGAAGDIAKESRSNRKKQS